MRHHILVGMLVAATVAAAGHAGEDPAMARGAELLAPFKKNLMQALQSGLQRGPAEAISVCRDMAPAIAAGLSVDGVVVGRASHRLRNPDNAAPDWVSPVIESWLAEGAERAPVVVPLPGSRTGYVEPILTQPLCLTCHGSSLAPDIAERLAADYPDDRATGFEVGDLRGVFWAEFGAAVAAGTGE
jgi:hypothetical protein